MIPMIAVVSALMMGQVTPDEPLPRLPLGHVRHT